MSEDNVRGVRDGYAEFAVTGRFDDEFTTEDFEWDMSNVAGWPEQQVYVGAEGARRFLADWVAVWDDWQMDVQEIHDAGERVVAILRQHARSKATGLPVDMVFAQVWTMRDGRRARMEMYSDPAAALRAVGLER